MTCTLNMRRMQTSQYSEGNHGTVIKDLPCSTTAKGRVVIRGTRVPLLRLSYAALGLECVGDACSACGWLCSYYACMLFR